MSDKWTLNKKVFLTYGKSYANKRLEFQYTATIHGSER